MKIILLGQSNNNTTRKVGPMHGLQLVIQNVSQEDDDKEFENEFNTNTAPNSQRTILEVALLRQFEFGR